VTNSIHYWVDDGFGTVFLNNLNNRNHYIELYPVVTSCGVQPFSQKIHLCAT